MSFALSAVIIVCSIIFAIGVCIQVAKGRLLLRYSLLWLALALLAIVFAIFPAPIFKLAYLLGFNVPSNFVLFVGVFFLAIICLSLSVIASRQNVRLKNAIQRIALLENKIEQASSIHENPPIH